MKKLFCLMALAIFAVGCEDNGDDYYLLDQFSREFDAYSEDWEFVDTEEGEAFYEIAFSMPELTNTVCRYNTVEAYMVENGVQFPLPDVRHYYDSPFGPWERKISYAFKPGVIYFNISYSDFDYDPENLLQPGDFTFRVVTTAPY